MTNADLDLLVLETARISDGELAEFPLEDAARQLFYETLAPSTTAPSKHIEISGRRKSRYPRVGIAAAAALFLTIIGVAIVSTVGSSNSAWAAPLVEFANSSPQLLIVEDGWDVTRADQYGDNEGEMTFTSSAGEADLFWRSRNHEDLLASRANGALRIEQRTVLGEAAQITEHPPGGGDYSALWRVGDRTMEFRASTESFEDFIELLGQVEKVETETWLSALPDSVIQQNQRGPVVREMLSDIPVPEGFDFANLEDTGGFSERYNVGAAVTGAVACSWIDQWVAATASGDTQSAQEAVDAMATSRDWAILQEMTAEGAWSEVLWEYADAIAGDGTVIGGRVLTVEESYRPALGCDVR